MNLSFKAFVAEAFDVEYAAALNAAPEFRKTMLADVIYKASNFDSSKHPRDDSGRFVGREQIHAAKSDPELAQKLRDKTTDHGERAKLDAALKGDVSLGRTKAGEHRERVAKQRQDRQERVAKAQQLANDISTARRGGEPVPASHYRELAGTLPVMTVAELRSVRGKLAASFGGDRRKEDMARRLVEHAKERAASMEHEINHAKLDATNDRYEDADPLDFGELHEYQNEGNAKGNEPENPNPEAEHGGRMAQRHMLASEHGVKDTVAYNERGADVKPYWKDAAGKNVDTITPTLSKGEAPRPRPTPTGSSVSDHVASAPTGWVGDDFLFINHAWDHVKGRPEYAGKSIEDFKGDLLKQAAEGKVKLGQADLPQGLDPADVAASHTEHPAMRGRHGGDFHFIRTPKNEGTTVVPSSPAGSASEAHQAADEYAAEAKRIANAPGGNPAAAIAHGEAANALRNVAKVHEQIQAEKDRYAEPAKRVEAANAKVGQAESDLASATEREKAAGAKVAELRTGGDPKENIAKLKDQLAASKAKTAKPAGSAILSDHSKALKAAATHFKRLQRGARATNKGQPIPPHVVYSDASGKVSAVRADTVRGEELTAGKLPHYTVHGTYEFDENGNPKAADPATQSATRPKYAQTTEPKTEYNEFSRGTETSISASKDGKNAGHITISHPREPDGPLSVGAMGVDKSHRRKGVSTQLHSEAFKYAQSQGKPLHSGMIISDENQKWWDKQVAAGNAVEAGPSLGSVKGVKYELIKDPLA